MKWNDLPEPNAKKYLDDKFDKNWEKFDVLKQGFIDETEAFQFARQLMGTFTSLMDGIDTNQLTKQDLAQNESKADDGGDEIEKALGKLGF